MTTRKPYADSFDIETVADWDADTSYLDQEEWEDRKREYESGGFGFIGVRATCCLHIPYGPRGYILQTITSPGLWGIEDDSGNEYLEEVGREETLVLRDMLTELSVTDWREDS